MKTLIISICSLFVCSLSSAFTLVNTQFGSNLQGWGTNDIKFVVNTANCPAGIDVPKIIEDAAEVWNNVSTSSVKVSYGGTTTSTTYGSPTTVYCETNFQAVLNADQNAVPGAANVRTAGGRITQGILYLNASSGRANIANFDATTLKIILAHEIGHVLGLGHSHTTNALMYFDAGAKNNFNLAQDDIDGVSYLYPKNELDDGNYAGCGLVKQLPPPPASGMMIMLFLLSLPVLIWGRLRLSRADRLLRLER